MRKHNLLLAGFLVLALFAMTIAVPAIPAKALTGTITISPTSGPPGTVVGLQGSGFTTNTTFTVYFGSTTPTTGTVSASGTISTTFTVPSNLTRQGYTVYVYTAAGDYSNYQTFNVMYTPNISLSGTSAGSGDRITVDGAAFSPSTSITFYFDSTALSPTTTSDVNGSFSAAPITIPPSSGGSHTIKATSSYGDTASASITITPKITVSPATGAVGATLTVGGGGFIASSAISFFLDDTAVTGSATAGANGSFSLNNFAVPARASGAHVLKAQDSSTNSATATITITSSMSISPTSGPAGTTITVTGNGYQASKIVIISFAGASVGALTTTNANGAFTTSFTAPPGASGPFQVTAGDGINNNSATFTLSGTGSIKTTQGPVGTSITISGAGFKASTPVSVTYGDSPVATVTSDATGNFSATFNAPPSSSGVHIITATDGTNKQTFNFTITPTSTINTTSGNVGTNVSVSGVGFASSKSVTVKYDATQVSSSTTDANGTFTAAFNAPPSAGGNHVVTVTDGTTTLIFNFAMDSTPPAAPQLLLPPDGQKTESTPAFDWSDVTDPSGVTYTLELASDATFADIILQKALSVSAYLITKEEELKTVSQDKPYYWRVKASDGANNDRGWSEPNTFLVGSIFPTWALYTIFGVAALILFILGYFLGLRMGHRRL